MKKTRKARKLAILLYITNLAYAKHTIKKKECTIKIKLNTITK